jgi:hypothetical protein
MGAGIDDNSFDKDNVLEADVVDEWNDKDNALDEDVVDERNDKDNVLEAGVLEERCPELNSTTPSTPLLSPLDTPDNGELSDASGKNDEVLTGWDISEDGTATTPGGNKDLITIEDLKGVDDNSPSRLEWIRQRNEEDATNKYIDELMTMVGLEDIKYHFLKMKSRAEVARRQEVDLSEERFNVVFVGNPGTGKSVMQEKSDLGALVSHG